MLTDAENRTLTQVGPGTPMGGLLRRYWHPVAAASELRRRPVKGLRVFGEDLALFRDRGGRYGLLGRSCPHRGADLSCGTAEERGLRCLYHGWRFDERGACVEMPFVERTAAGARFKRGVAARAYPVEEKAGLLWAYLGPAPAPLVPNWEPFSRRGMAVRISFYEVPCNWLQCQENAIDPLHFEWLHNRWAGRKGAGTHVRLAFEEFEHGFVYRRLTEGMSEDDPLWRTGRVCLWPNGFLTRYFSWKVPIDDRSTLSVVWKADAASAGGDAAGEAATYVSAGELRGLLDAARERRPARGFDELVLQDILALTSQGVVADRTGERLAAGDEGILMLRRRLLEQARVVAAGGEPKGLVRDRAKNECLALPFIQPGPFSRRRAAAAPKGGPPAR